MRKALKQLNGERRRFSGTFCRFGEKPGWKGRTLITLLLKNIKDANGKIVSDHLWFNLTKEFDNLTLKEDITVVSFDARVKLYYKGYQGYREDVYDKPVERDFRLANPTKVQVVPYTAEYEANVRKLQETAVWHLLKGDVEHEVYCGENSANTIATDDVSIVKCPKCLELFEAKYMKKSEWVENKDTVSYFETEQAKLVQDWNIMHSVGIDVIVTKDDKIEQRTKTCSAAWMLGASGDYPGHTAVIMLDGISGCYALERVREAKP